MEHTKILDKYIYFESDKEFYYHKSLNIIFDNDKNVLPFSNNCTIFNVHLKNFKNSIKNIDITKIISTYNNIICIQHWYNTYGHFKDELYNLYNFYTLFNNNTYNVLMNYVKPSFIGYKFDNYDKLTNLLFESHNFINIANTNDNIIKIKNLILINHHIISPMFHMFPEIPKNKILSKIEYSNNFNKNIFITRGKALHLKRNLDNQQELEEYFSNMNYNVINPEIIDIELFIQQIKDAENVYITWGGAMVNLCYVNPNANIYLLQSLSYKKESIFFIFKFLKTYNNLYLIKCNDNNKIEIPFTPIKLSYS
jgi:hypothetical protein